MHDTQAAEAAQRCSPPHATRGQDTGGQGEEPAGVRTRQPPPTGQEGSGEDTCLTPLLSSARVVVDHVLAGVTRCRMVTEGVRLTTEGLAALVMEMACGGHNLRVRCRHPFPTCEVLSLLSSG